MSIRQVNVQYLVSMEELAQQEIYADVKRGTLVNFAKSVSTLHFF